MTCSLCRSAWGCQSSVRPAGEVCYHLGLPVGHDHAVVLVEGSGLGLDLDGGGRAVVGARWEMGCGYE